MKAWDQRTTYRVRQLPWHLHDRDAARELLVRLEPSLGPADNMRIFPLASSANIWERRPSKTATVMFKRQPAFLADGGEEWVLPAREAGHEENVIVDVHFLDFTVFNDVAPEEHVLNCIAISGLSSHAFGSWRSHGPDPSFMWLRDKLPRDIPGIRSIIYGYDTKLLMSTSIQTVDDIARTFIHKLEAIGCTSQSSKPIVFLAHSLGGIILKKALVMLARSGDAERFILLSISAIILFGVPSKGMHISHLLPMVEGQPNENLIRVLAPDSEYLETLEEQFNGITNLQHIRLVSVYETGLSKTAQRKENRAWARDGPLEMLVNPISAVSPSSGNNDKIPIDQDHSNMVKFAEGDSNYGSVVKRIYDVYQHVSNDSHNNHGHVDQPSMHQKQLPTTANLDDLMKSLKLETSTHRLDDIKDAYKNTFPWIYKNQEIGFVQWLQQTSSSIFWIRGKPGSGKSTLMKYITKHPRTKEILINNGTAGKIIPICFFFHNRGSHLQKSLEGLYRDLIYQILNQTPELERTISHIYKRLKARARVIWTLSDLEEAFSCILTQQESQTRIILFLDALDEYDGPLERITDFVNGAATKSSLSTTTVQICFSSRPWNHFLLRFKACFGLQIHDYTVEDVRNYIVGRLQSDPATSTLLFPSGISGRNNDFIERVVTKAEGVFLWVRVVVDELIRAATDGEDLEEVFSSLPTDLANLYRWTMERIPNERRIRIESYVMFEIVFRAFDALEVNQFAMAVSCAFSETFKDGIDRVAKSDAQCHHAEFSESFSRRVKSRTGGLIEIVDTVFGRRVQFMHQSVKDFVGDPGFHQYAFGRKEICWSDNGYTFLSKYYLVRLEHPSPNYKVVDRIGHSRDDFLDECMNYTYLSEVTTGKSLNLFLSGIGDATMRMAFNMSGLDFAWLRRRFLVYSVLSFAVCSNLQLFVKEKLQEKVNVNFHTAIPLLHCAVEMVKRSRLSPFREGNRCKPSEMVRILLAHGADIDTRVQGMTAFQLLFRTLGFKDGDIPRKPLPPEERSGMNELDKTVEIFLSHGADPNTSFWAHDVLSDPDWRQPLHVADIFLIKVLLGYGASVNALNSDGNTPLDVRYLCHGQINAEEACTLSESMLLLIQHGGRATTIIHARRGTDSDSLTALQRCVEKLERHFEVDPRIKSPLMLHGAPPVDPPVELTTPGNEERWHWLSLRAGFR